MLSLALLAAGLALPLPALAGPVELATSPMATSTTTTVKPNLMFVLDDSGSMDWDYMPDPAKNFAGKYGFNSNQCNGNYYNPAVTYLAPVKPDATGTTPTPALNATATSFSAAYKDGYNTGAGTTNLSTGFTGGSGTGQSGINLNRRPGLLLHLLGRADHSCPAELLRHQQHFLQGMQQQHRFVSGQRRVHARAPGRDPDHDHHRHGPRAAAGATITITDAGTRNNPAKFTSIKVNVSGDKEIMSGQTNTSRTASTLARLCRRQDQRLHHDRDRQLPDERLQRHREQQRRHHSGPPLRTTVVTPNLQHEYADARIGDRLPRGSPTPR